MNEKKVILLVNTGSPDAPDKKNLAKYLRQFLMDYHIIDIPWFFRFLLVNLIIVPFRARRSAEYYKNIWTESGSPLKFITESLVEKLNYQKGEFSFYFAMRYGNPSIKNQVSELYEKGFRNITLFPMFPHYSYSTYESVIDEFRKCVEKFPQIQYQIAAPFYNHKEYIKSLYGISKKYLTKDVEHVLISYHSIPERHLKRVNKLCLSSPDCCEAISIAHARCYKHQIMETSRLFAEKSGIDRKKFTITFQSAMSSKGWLVPDTEKVIKELGEKGIKNLAIISPGFTIDNLETLDELNIRYKKIFFDAGGKKFQYIPALNDSMIWVESLQRLLKSNWN